MKVKFDEQDLLVLMTGYGHKIVRTDVNSGDEVYVATMPSEDEFTDDTLLWRGNLEGCMKALAMDLGILMSQPGVWQMADTLTLTPGAWAGTPKMTVVEK